VSADAQAAPPLSARHERLREFISRFERADDVDVDEQVDLVDFLLEQARLRRLEAAA